MSKRAKKRQYNLTINLVLFVFGVMMVVFLIESIFMVIMHYFGMFKGMGKPPFFSILGVLFICVLLGTALTAFFSKTALKPIRKVIEATHKVAKGDFSVKVDIEGVRELEELSNSFNKMTQELSSIETLRSDFINCFSHEFKTPIVSVRGFAKLLKKGNLSEAEKEEYLDIIITESERLAQLSTNVLNLVKYENIEIITEKEPFRLDEQIRRAILMTEPKWSAKNIEMNVEMYEIIFNGNEDLTQQIWLNLLDNAIKFSNGNGRIDVRLFIWNGKIRFSIKDNGSGMDEQTKEHIFDKFYQGDLSHSKTGNGLGLSITKRIVQLCGGTIDVDSEVNKGSEFIIVLPKEL